jgi:hypothetical protein
LVVPAVILAIFAAPLAVLAAATTLSKAVVKVSARARRIVSAAFALSFVAMILIGGGKAEKGDAKARLR